MAIKYLRSISLVCFEGEGSGDPSGQDDKDTGGQGGKDTGGQGGKSQLLTQEQVNKILADDRRKHQAKQKEMLTQLEQLQNNQKLTEEERATLNQQVEELRIQTTTAEERARTALDRQKKDYDGKVTSLTTERDVWQSRFTNAVITTEITNAAVENEAFSPNQISAMLRSNTRLIEEVDAEGKPTGNLIPKVKFQAKDKENNDITLDLTVSEAVKKMKETPEIYGNLFKSTAAGGLGSTTVPGNSNGKVNFKNLTPAQYRKLRKENPAVIYNS